MATFVAARAGDGLRSRTAAVVLRRVASKFLLSQAQPVSRFYKGGLRPTTHRHIEDLIKRRVETAQGGFTDVGQLAAKAGLSVNHFIRAFRQMTGTTPHQHVMALRSQRAMALLREPGLPVVDVADLLGFASPAHFVASFRKRLGVTPGAYRNAVLSPGVPAGALRR